MELLKAVNTILPYLGEHVITRIEGAKHPTVDLALAAIDRQRIALLSTGWWFNEETKIIPVNTDGRIEVPKDTLVAKGLDCDVVVRGEKFYDTANDTRYFTRPIKVKTYVDLAFDELPDMAALYIVYMAGIEVYTADLGAENALSIMQQFANMNISNLRQENLRQRQLNPHRIAARRSRYNWLRQR